MLLKEGQVGNIQGGGVEWTLQEKEQQLEALRKQLEISRVTSMSPVVVPQGAWGGISFPPPQKKKKNSPQIMTNVLKLDQIWWFWHKGGKNIKFLHASHALFHFLLHCLSIRNLWNPCERFMHKNSRKMRVSHVYNDFVLKKPLKIWKRRSFLLNWNLRISEHAGTFWI